VTPTPDRVDGYLSNKAQQLEPTALVYERADGSWFLVWRSREPVGLGDSFADATRALRAALTAERAKRESKDKGA
jgi:hypothetical protein